MKFSLAQEKMTYLAMVRADVSQITHILDQSFSQCEDKARQGPSVMESVEVAFRQYTDQARQFLFGQINHDQIAEALRKSSSAGKGVCAKTLRAGDVAWKCETCEKDPTCIICQECFEAGDHKGHKVWLKRNVGGCCDCGDPDAWREEGFCSKHKGYAASADELMENLPPYIKKAAVYVFDHICLKLKIKSLQLQTSHSSRGTGYKGFVNPEAKKQRELCSNIIHILFDMMDWAVETSPAFIHFLTQSLDKTYLREVRKAATLEEKSMPLGLQKQPRGEDDEEDIRSHDCCVKAYITEEDRVTQSKELTDLIIEEDGRDSIFLGGGSPLLIENASSPDLISFSEATLADLRLSKALCTCSALDLTFQANHLFPEPSRLLQHELFFKMFQLFRFKQQLALSFAANFETVQTVGVEGKTKHRIGGIGVQLLTIEEVALMIMRDEGLRGAMVATYAKMMEQLVEDGFTERDQSIMYSILYDFKYMARAKCLEYTINETNFLEQLLQPLAKLYYQDKLELRTQHVTFDLGIIKDGLYNMEIMLVKICKNYLKAVSPLDIPRNRKLMAVFLSLLDEVNKEMPGTEEGTRGKVGFFAVPLHRVFSYYLSRLVMQNYLTEAAQGKGANPREVFRDIIKRFIVIPPGENTWRYIQELIETIIRPVARSWAFTHEVMSGKWVMSGLFINQLPKIFYSVYEYYLLLSLGLFQVLLAISPEPARTLQALSDAFAADQWMRRLHESLLASQAGGGAIIEAEGFEKLGGLFDEKKVRQMLHWELRLITQMAVTEAGFVAPLITNLSQKENLTYPIRAQCNKAIEEVYRREMRRAIVHNLMLLGGRAEIKALKHRMEEIDIYTESEFFEDELLTVADHKKDPSTGKIQFILKESDYLSWFEPYYYLQPASQVKVQEVFQGIYADRKLPNEILGDFNSAYQYPTPINSVICDALSQSQALFRLLTSILSLWCTEAQPEQKAVIKVVDDQIGYEAMKIMHLISQGVRGHLAMIEVMAHLLRGEGGDWALVKKLVQKGQQCGPGTPLEKAVKELLGAYYHLDHAQFSYIGEAIGLKKVESPAALQFEDFEQLEQSMSVEEPKISGLELKRQQSRKKKDEILKKMHAQRQEFSKRQIAQNQLTQSASSGFKEEGKEDEVECALCKETLTLEHYYGNPFGQFAYVSSTKLLYHSYRQALIKSHGSNKTKTLNDNPDEEEKKESELSQMQKLEEEEACVNPLDHLNVNCIELANGTGGTLVKCSHYAHQKCLESFLTANEADTRKRDMRKLIGFSFETFQCPLCKHIANVLLPSDQLAGYSFHKLDQADFDPYELLEFHTRIISKILQKQECRKKALLPVDLRREPLAVMQGVQRFLEHRIQLIDVKGVGEFLNKQLKGPQYSLNRTTKDQYADVLSITQNVMRLSLEGVISSTPKSSSDVDMTEDTVESLCQQEIKTVLETCKGWRFILNDFSSMALQLMYWSVMSQGFSSLSALDHTLSSIASSLYPLHKLQVLLRALYSLPPLPSSPTPTPYTEEVSSLDPLSATHHPPIPTGPSGLSLRGTPKELYQRLSSRLGLLALAAPAGATSSQGGFAGQGFVEQYVVPPQLAFARKLAAFKAVVHTAYIRGARRGQGGLVGEVEAATERMEGFLQEMSKQVDDNEEMALLSEYLGLQREMASESELPEELHEILTYLRSEEQQDKALESYALSVLINHLNPSLALNDQDKPMFKEQLLSQAAIFSETVISLPLPPQLALLTSGAIRFKLEELPGDFQTLVQTYYKRKCRNCNTQPKDACVCLLCGDLVCFIQKCCQGVLPGMKANEGELTFHCRTCEGGQALYLQISNGKVIMIDDDRSSHRASPYVNRFGETFSQSSKRWDNFHLQTGSATGAPSANQVGANTYEEFRRLYLNFALPNEVMKDRSISDSVWHLRVI